MAFKMVYGGVNLPQKYGNFFSFKNKYLKSTAVLLVASQIRTVQNIHDFKNSWHTHMLHVRTSATVRQWEITANKCLHLVLLSQQECNLL